MSISVTCCADGTLSETADNVDLGDDTHLTCGHGEIIITMSGDHTILPLNPGETITIEGGLGVTDYQCAA